MKNILVIGSLNMDLVINTNRLPKMGETIYGTGFNTVAGGKGQNQAIASKRMGLDVKMIGAVGNDIFGEKLIKNLSDDKIDTKAIKKWGTNSGIAIITVMGGDNQIILESGANKLVDEKIIDENIDLLKWCDIVLFQFEIPKETVYYAIKKAREFGKTVILNPAPMIDFDKEILQYVDVFIPNEHEAGTMLDMKIETIDDAILAVERLLELGIKTPIITLGNKGSVYYEQGKIKHQSVFKVDVVDTTAAGDSFIGGIAKGLANNWDLSRTVLFSTALSSLVITKKGATVSIPELEEVEEFLKNN